MPTAIRRTTWSPFLKRSRWRDRSIVRLLGVVVSPTERARTHPDRPLGSFVEMTRSHRPRFWTTPSVCGEPNSVAAPNRATAGPPRYAYRATGRVTCAISKATVGSSAGVGALANAAIVAPTARALAIPPSSAVQAPGASPVWGPGGSPFWVSPRAPNPAEMSLRRSCARPGRLRAPTGRDPTRPASTAPPVGSPRGRSSRPRSRLSFRRPPREPSRRRRSPRPFLPAPPRHGQPRRAPPRERWASASAGRSAHLREQRSPLGRQAKAERDEHGAGDAFERPPDPRPPQEVARARDDRGVGRQPREGQRAEDEAESDEGEERMPELREEADEEDGHLRVAEVADEPLPEGLCRGEARRGHTARQPLAPSAHRADERLQAQEHEVRGAREPEREEGRLGRSQQRRQARARRQRPACLADRDARSREDPAAPPSQQRVANGEGGVLSRRGDDDERDAEKRGELGKHAGILTAGARARRRRRRPRWRHAPCLRGRGR